MKQVNVHYAKTHLSRLLEEVARGEEIIIAKAGKPFARLVGPAMPSEPKKSAWELAAGMQAGRLTEAQLDYLCGPTDPEITAAFEADNIDLPKA